MDSGPLGLALASLAGFAVLYLLFVRVGAGSDFDQAALLDRPDELAISRTDLRLFDAGPPALAIALLGGFAWARRGWRLAFAVAAAFAVLVGVGLLALDWHRPSEVAAGYLLAVAIACGAVPLASRGSGGPWHSAGTAAVAYSLTGLFLAFVAVSGLVYAADHGVLGDWVALAVSELLLAALAIRLLVAFRRAIGTA